MSSVIQLHTEQFKINFLGPCVLGIAAEMRQQT